MTHWEQPTIYILSGLFTLWWGYSIYQIFRIEVLKEKYTPEKGLHYIIAGLGIVILLAWGIPYVAMHGGH